MDPAIQPSNNSNSLTIISMAIFVLLSLSIVGFLYYQNQQLKEIIANYPTPVVSISPSITPSPTIEATSSASPKACTMEAKICPDGSSVGRTGPNCEFAPCPTP